MTLSEDGSTIDDTRVYWMLSSGSVATCLHLFLFTGLVHALFGVRA